MFDGFSHRTLPAGPDRDERRSRAHLGRSIGDRHSITCLAHHGQIRQIITDHSRFRGRQSELREDFVQRCRLVRRTHDDVLDAKFTGTVRYGHALSAGDNRNVIAQLPPCHQPQSIVCVEPLGFDAVVV